MDSGSDSKNLYLVIINPAHFRPGIPARILQKTFHEISGDPSCLCFQCLYDDGVVHYVEVYFFAEDKVEINPNLRLISSEDRWEGLIPKVDKTLAQEGVQTAIWRNDRNVENLTNPNEVMIVAEDEVRKLVLKKFFLCHVLTVEGKGFMSSIRSPNGNRHDTSVCLGTDHKAYDEALKKGFELSKVVDE